MSSTLPAAWVERIFARMTAVYGVQKMAAMWTGVDSQEVKRCWGDALAKYPTQAISDAVLAMPDECGQWPPTLTEFVALVKSKVPAPEHRPALPVPRRTDAEIAAGREQMARIKAMLRTAVKPMPTGANE